MIKQKRVKTLLSTLLAVMLVCSLMPAVAFADDDAAVTEMLEAIAGSYLNTTNDWAAMAMASFGRAGDVAGASIIRNAGSVYADPESSKTDIARVIITLTSLGVDAAKVYSGNDGVYLNFIGKLLEKPPAMPNDAIFGLNALDSGEYGNAQDRETYIRFLLGSQVQHAAGQIRWTWGFGDGEWDIDITAMAATALAAYDNIARPDVRAAVKGALAFLSAQQTPEGHFGDANSTAMVVVALASMGIDPGARTGDFAKDGNSLIDGLLEFRSDNNKFWIADWTTGEPTEDDMATEQGFRALAAYSGFIHEGGAYNIYRFGPQTGDGSELADKHGPGRHADVKIVPVSSPGKTFADIQGHVNQAAIEALAERSIIMGKSETSFEPDATMTRAEFAAIVTRSLGLPAAGRNVFQDVPAHAWYAAPVAAAYYYEIVRGTSPDTFNPNGTITRQEAVVMVVRAARLAGLDTGRTEIEIRDTLAQFGDYRTAASWAQESLAFCYSEGILDDLEFEIKPGEPVERAEIAEMLYRMLEKANLL